MARWLHHVRAGETEADRRDLQANGRARAIGPWRGVHATFRAPGLVDVPGQVDAYTGFAADGQWYEHGRRVTAALAEPLGDAQHDFNSHKWTIVNDSMPWAQDAVGLNLAPEVPSQFGVQGRFELRGDFHVRLIVASTTMAYGLDGQPGQDNAVYLGVRAATALGSAWRVKHTRNATFDNNDGFAAETPGGGSMDGYVAQAVESGDFYILALRRDNDVLRLIVTLSDNTVVEVWNGPSTGRLLVEWGARSTGADPWTAAVGRFSYVSGWHNYSSLASWAIERAHGALFEEFVGAELDDRLWTPAFTGNGYVTCGAVEQRGLRLGLAGAGDAQLDLVPIVGDFTLRMGVRVVRSPSYVHDFEAPDTLFGVDLAMPPVVMAHPRLRLEVVATRYDGGGVLPDETKIVPRIMWDPGDGVEAVLVSGDEIPDLDPALDVTIERRGQFVLFTLESQHDGTRPLVYTAEGLLPTAHAALRLRTESGGSTGATWTVDVPNVRVTSPHALNLDAWPGDYYGAGALALAAEVTNYALSEDVPPFAQLTLLGVETRAPFWRIVGAMQKGGASAAAALPAGAVGDVFADPAGGRIVIPVATPDVEGDGGFVIVDLQTDEITLKRGPDELAFGGPVGWRHFDMGYLPISSGPAVDAPPVGAALGYDEVEAGGTLVGDAHVWTTAAGIRLVAANLAEQQLSALVLANNDPEANGETQTYRTVTLAPLVAPQGACLVVAARRRNDIALMIYRDVAATIQAGDEVFPGGSASARYTGDDPDPLNVDMTPGVVYGGADMTGDGIPDVHAVRPTSEAAGGRPLVAMARRWWGAALIQDAIEAGDVLSIGWPIADAIGEIGEGGGALADDGTELGAGPVACRLSPDANAIPGERAGWLALGEGDAISSEFFVIRGAIEAIALPSMRVRTRLDIRLLDVDEFAPGVDRRCWSQGLAIIYPPPGVLAGLRLLVGLYASATGVLEYDLLSLAGGPWTGPHIGGTTLALQGFGLDEVVDVEVGGLDCFRLALDVRPDPPILRCVNRALGWIEHPEAGSPVMSNAELEATALWPKDVLLRWRDGAELLVPEGFVYESNLCIEATLARLLGRLPPAILDPDPKSNWPQRHLLVALAFLICRVVHRFHVPMENDFYIKTATSIGLQHIAGSYAAAPPYAGMTDEQVRAFAIAKIGGSRLTTKAIRDLLEPIFGARPTMTEGYREFTIHVVLPAPGGATSPRNFWGDLDDADPASGGYMDRDFWGGDDPRLVAARRVLDICRAAGVRANLVVEDA